MLTHVCLTTQKARDEAKVVGVDTVVLTAKEEEEDDVAEEKEGSGKGWAMNGGGMNKGGVTQAGGGPGGVGPGGGSGGPGGGGGGPGGGGGGNGVSMLKVGERKLLRDVLGTGNVKGQIMRLDEPPSLPQVLCDVSIFCV